MAKRPEDGTGDRAPRPGWVALRSGARRQFNASNVRQESRVPPPLLLRQRPFGCSSSRRLNPDHETRHHPGNRARTGFDKRQVDDCDFNFINEAMRSTTMLCVVMFACSGSGVGRLGGLKGSGRASGVLLIS